MTSNQVLECLAGARMSMGDFLMKEAGGKRKHKQSGKQKNASGGGPAALTPEQESAKALNDRITAQVNAGATAPPAPPPKPSAPKPSAPPPPPKPLPPFVPPNPPVPPPSGDSTLGGRLVRIMDATKAAGTAVADGASKAAAGSVKLMAVAKGNPKSTIAVLASTLIGGGVVGGARKNKMGEAPPQKQVEVPQPQAAPAPVKAEADAPAPAEDKGSALGSTAVAGVSAGALGSVLGYLVDGWRGAGIGAVAGGAVGTGAALLSRE